MLRPTCPERQPCVEAEGCDTRYWQQVSRFSLLALDRKSLSAQRKVLSLVNQSHVGQHGCAIGRLVTALLKLSWLSTSKRLWHWQEYDGALFDMPCLMATPMWPMYRLMQELQLKVWRESANTRLSHCDLQGAPGMAILRQELLLGALKGAALHPALILLDMNQSEVCPLASAAALWAVAASKHGGGPCPTSHVLRLLHQGNMMVKHWRRSQPSFYEFFSTRWPLWDSMAQLESGIRLPASNMDEQIMHCPHGNRNILTIGLESVRVEAVVVFGRADRLRILHRYLLRNLRINGGLLDHVMFVVLRATHGARKFLSQLVAKHAPHYSIPLAKGKRFAKIYSVCQKIGTIYIKIDDDIVYISDAAIPSLIREHQRQRCSFVSANVVNHGILSSLHDEVGALRVFLPPALNFKRKTNFTSEQAKKPATHWRRADGERPINVISRTPQSKCVWASWECAAWMHESLLSRLADRTTCAYDFGWYGFHTAGFEAFSKAKNRFLPLQTSRWSINFFAFTRESLEAADWDRLAEDDEAELSYKAPSRIGVQACAVGRALVSHFSYWKQDSILMVQTDLLYRYDVLSEALMQDTMTI